MPAVARTLGPLHLEDLEPHRFEDLIRQLLYDFRPWRDLEATGRTGTDEGFDVRAWEVVGYDPQPTTDEVDEQVQSPELSIERQWLIQCKREKAIGPKKLRSYLDGLPRPSDTGLYGLIFVAACDFSIAARDAFYAHTRALGFQEVKLWGKAEVEDQLFQPKNDHLLFAYFGISLQVRRRSVASSLRAVLAIKRKARKALTPISTVIILDATDERYPYLDPNPSLQRHLRGRWRVFEVDRVGARGVALRQRRQFAFIDDDHVHWDYAECMNDALPHNDPWQDAEEIEAEPKRSAGRSSALAKWDTLPNANKGCYEVSIVLPFEAIIDIDPDGDVDVLNASIIYTQQFSPNGHPPFADYVFERLYVNNWSPSVSPNSEHRVEFFDRLVT